MALPVEPTFGRAAEYTTTRTAVEAFRQGSFTTPTNMYHGNGARQEPLNFWQKVTMRADSIRDAMGDKCCRCLHHMPSLVLIIGILVLIGLAIAAVPLAFVLISNAGGSAEELRAGAGDLAADGHGIFFHPIREGHDWPGYNDDTESSSSREDKKDALRVTSTAALFPPNVSLCHGFGFACASQPSRVIPTAARCDGKPDCSDGSDEANCRECQTPFWCELDGGASDAGGAARVRLCLRAEHLCDGVRHCPDNADETSFCHKAAEDCPTGTRRCEKTPLCLAEDSFCDGIRDCQGDEDEQRCTSCKRGAKMCAATGSCIPANQLCDGMVDCPDGSDEKECDCKSCSGSDRALCGNGRCIDRSKVCDGTIDCEGGIDEQNCPGTCRAANASSAATASSAMTATLKTIQCADGRHYPEVEACSGRVRACDRMCPKCNPRLAHTCADGACIRKEMVCDGNLDCSGGDDEQGCEQSCSAKGNIFKCVESGKCIAKSAQCDGVRDCPDGSDEQNCTKCPSDALRCLPDKSCLPAIARCDGVLDCSDGSDEADCTCQECTGAHTDTYACETTHHCFRRDAVCDPYSKCPNATHTDRLFCAAKALQKFIL